MEKKRRKISLGFTNEEFLEGVHVCQIFHDDRERHEAFEKFIINGLIENEMIACYSDNESLESILEILRVSGKNYQELELEGGFTFSKTSDFYFENNKFLPERMLKSIRAFYNKSQHKHPGARIIGEKSPKVQEIEGGSRLMEYEAKISLLLRECPVTSVCQYDSKSFDGSTIIDVLKVHPFTILKGSIVHNPFFIPPEEFLS